MLNRILVAGLAVAACVGISRPAAAQIQLEHQYTSSTVQPVQLAPGRWAYYDFQASTAQLVVYHLDHSLAPPFRLPVLAGYQLLSVDFLSAALFDTDSSTLEAAVVYTTPWMGGAMGKTLIVREDGSTLAVLDTATIEKIINTQAGTKMLVDATVWAGGSMTNRTRVYALPGHLALSRPKDSHLPDAERATPYPNPTAGQLHLPYTVPPGLTATLIVRDGVGREVRRFSVDDTFADLLLDSRLLAPGVYSYAVEVPGRAPLVGRPFVVSR